MKKIQFEKNERKDNRQMKKIKFEKNERKDNRQMKKIQFGNESELLEYEVYIKDSIWK